MHVCYLDTQYTCLLPRYAIYLSVTEIRNIPVTEIHNLPVCHRDLPCWQLSASGTRLDPSPVIPTQSSV